jgi:hypothetical protein
MKTISIPLTLSLAAAIAPGCVAGGANDEEGPVGSSSSGIVVSGGVFVPDTSTCSRSIGEHAAKNSWLGAPIHWTDQLLPDGGRYRDYAAGTVILHPRYGCAYFVRWGFHQQWNSEGRTLGPRGYPVSDELSPGAGRSYQYFDRGSMFWQTSTGVRALSGAIAVKQFSMGLYPISDQTSSDGVGQRVDLESQHTIFASPSSGAWAVRYGIRAHYLSLQAERSGLGYPVSDEECVTLSEPTCTSRFQYGRIKWTPSRGTWEERYASDAESFVKVPSPGEVAHVHLVVDKIESITPLNTWGLADDLAMRVTGLHTDPSVVTIGEMNPWRVKLPTITMRAGETRTLTQGVFTATAAKNVRYGESVAFHVALTGGYRCYFTGCSSLPPEAEEIGGFYRILEFPELRAQLGKTINFVDDIRDSRAHYRVYSHAFVERVQHEPPRKPAYAAADPAAYAGTYDWNVDGHRDTATLVFLPPSPTRAEPAFTGLWNEAGKTMVINTKRIVGNYVELYLTPAGVALDAGGRSPRRMTGYLVKGPNGQGLAIAGTAWNQDQTWGFFMTRRP